MPKLVDHGERREQLSEVAMGVIAELGGTGATLRNIADEAGVSVGILQHYFRTKEELLLSAYERAAERLRARFEQVQETSVAGIKRIATETLPLNAARRVEWRVLLAFRAAAISDPSLAIVQRKRWEAFRRYFARLICEAQGRGEVPGTIDVDQTSYAIVNLIDGTAITSLFMGRKWKADDQLTAMLDAIDRLLLTKRS